MHSSERWQANFELDEFGQFHVVLRSPDGSEALSAPASQQDLEAFRDAITSHFGGADVRLSAEEVAFLRSSDWYCERCPHHEVFHDEENDCLIPGCGCELSRFLAEHAGHTIVEQAGGGSRGPHVGWGYSIQPPYVECTDCRSAILKPASKAG